MNKNRNKKNITLFIVMNLVILAGIGIVNAAVWTDQLDYVPGTTVTISGDNSNGAGYVTEEIVHVDVAGPNGYRSSCSSQVDSSGAWSCQVVLSPDDSAVGEYTYTAVGQNVTESGTFSDSVISVTITSPTTVSPVTITSLPATVTISFGYTTSSGTTTGEANIGGSWSNSKSLVSGSGKSDSIVVTIPTGTANGAYAAKVKVSNSAGSGAVQKVDTQPNTVIVNVPSDTTQPVITPSITGTSGINGWYTSDVVMSWTVTDPESGITSKSGCDVQTLSSETAGTTIMCSAVNGAGLSSSNSVTIKIDKTGPGASLSIKSGTLGTNGWYVNDVVVSTIGSDPVSDSVTCTSDQTFSSETTGITVTGSCTNGAGLTTNAAPLTIKIDKTGPIASLSVRSGTLGTNNWYASIVVVSTTGSDTISSPVTCDPDQTKNADTIGITVSGSCKNDAGLIADAIPMPLKIDTTAPTGVHLVPSGIMGGSGWFTSDVTMNTVGDELISTPFICTDAQHFTSDVNGLIVNGNCINDAGLKADAVPLTLNIDKAQPTTTDNTPAGWQKAPFTVILTCTDGGSGCDNTYYTLDGGTSGTGTPGNSIDITTDGSHTITYYSVDKAGNRETTKITYAKLDTVPPSIVASAKSDGVDYTSGTWTNKDVIVSFSCTDVTSGVASCAGPQTISTEGKDQSAAGSATDNAGNTASVTFTGIDIDKTPPVTTDDSPAGWKNADFTVTLTCSDTGSGCKQTQYSIDGGSWNIGTSISISSEGDYTIQYYSTDNTGNTETTKTTHAKLDKTPPVVTATADRSPDSNDWYNKLVTISFAGTDSLSGVTNCDADKTYNGPDGSSVSVSGSCTDNAGNVGTGSLSFKYDATPPTITGSKTPSPNPNDWNNVDVKVHFDCNDATSGIVSCTPDTTVSTDGTGQSVAGIATDQAGNTASATVGDINIDKTPPSITASASTSDGIYTSGTWTNKDVKVHFSCGDALSGVASCTPDTTVSTEGSGQSATGSVSDKAGNTVSATFSGINIDKSAPVITITTPKDGTSYILNQPVVADYACTDTLSGVATCSGNVPKGSNIDTGSVGTKTFAVNTADNSGNSGTKSVTYYVKYIFGGILQPINADGSSIFKFGSTVPVKFQLADYNGNYISTAVATISMAKVDNNVEGTYVEAVSTSAATTGNLFRYDSTSNQYIFNLATKPLSTGTWNIKISINDGTTYIVKISLK